MPDIKFWILTSYVIGVSDSCDLQTWSALCLSISDIFHIGYPGKYDSLPLMNFFGSTLEFIYFQIPQRMGISCVGSSCRCVTCLHYIWVSWCTPNTPEGHWPYLLPFLCPLRTHSCTCPRSPSWCYLSNSSWEMKVVSDPTIEKNFHH